MGRIDRIPFISGVLAAIITGAASYVAGGKTSTGYLRMIVMMLVFFIIGMYVRKTIRDIKRELQDKKEEQEGLEKSKENPGSGDGKTAPDSINPQMQSDADAGKDKPQKQQAHKLDLSAGVGDDGFQPLELGKAVSSKLKEQKGKTA